MANCNGLADDMRWFWGEERLRASHEKRIMGDQVEMVEEGEIGAWKGEWIPLGSQGREKYRWERTRAFSARKHHPSHIWSYHGSSRRRSSLPRPCGSAGRRTAVFIVDICTVLDPQRHAPAFISTLVFFCQTQTCIKL